MRPMLGVIIATAVLLAVSARASEIATLPGGETATLATLRNSEKGLVELIDRLARTVVTVTGWHKREDRPGSYRIAVRASGFIISPDGDIVTNEHVLREQYDKITVTLWTGEEYSAKVVGSDPRTDLAVLKIKAKKLSVVRLGHLRQVRRGQWVLAMGNPCGLAYDGQAAASLGIVSAVGRHIPKLDRVDRYYGNMIQTTAPINLGNSGGPLFNLDGEVIAVNAVVSTAKINDTEHIIAFGIPISKWTRQVLAVLQSGKTIEYGYLGVQLDDLPGRAGALAAKVLAGTPADKAGVLPEDIIVEYDGQRVRNTADLIGMIGMTRPGNKVTLKVERNGRIVQTSLVVAPRKHFVSLLAGTSRPTSKDTQRAQKHRN